MSIPAFSLQGCSNVAWNLVKSSQKVDLVFQINNDWVGGDKSVNSLIETDSWIKI